MSTRTSESTAGLPKPPNTPRRWDRSDEPAFSAFGPPRSAAGIGSASPRNAGSSAAYRGGRGPRSDGPNIKKELSPLRPPTISTGPPKSPALSRDKGPASSEIPRTPKTPSRRGTRASSATVPALVVDPSSPTNPISPSTEPRPTSRRRRSHISKGSTSASKGPAEPMPESISHSNSNRGGARTGPPSPVVSAATLKDVPPHRAVAASAAPDVTSFSSRLDIDALVTKMRAGVNRPSTPGSGHIDWAGDDDESLPDLDDWGVTTTTNTGEMSASDAPTSGTASSKPSPGQGSGNSFGSSKLHSGPSGNFAKIQTTTSSPLLAPVPAEKRGRRERGNSRRGERGPKKDAAQSGPQADKPQPAPSRSPPKPETHTKQPLLARLTDPPAPTPTNNNRLGLNIHHSLPPKPAGPPPVISKGKGPMAPEQPTPTSTAASSTSMPTPSPPEATRSDSQVTITGPTQEEVSQVPKKVDRLDEMIKKSVANVAKARKEEQEAAAVAKAKKEEEKAAAVAKVKREEEEAAAVAKVRKEEAETAVAKARKEEAEAAAEKARKEAEATAVVTVEPPPKEPTATDGSDLLTLEKEKKAAGEHGLAQSIHAPKEPIPKSTSAPSHLTVHQLPPIRSSPNLRAFNPAHGRSQTVGRPEPRSSSLNPRATPRNGNSPTEPSTPRGSGSDHMSRHARTHSSPAAGHRPVRERPVINADAISRLARTIGSAPLKRTVVAPVASKE